MHLIFYTSGPIRKKKKAEKFKCRKKSLVQQKSKFPSLPRFCNGATKITKIKNVKLA